MKTNKRKIKKYSYDFQQHFTSAEKTLYQQDISKVAASWYSQRAYKQLTISKIILHIERKKFRQYVSSKS